GGDPAGGCRARAGRGVRAAAGRGRPGRARAHPGGGVRLLRRDRPTGRGLLPRPHLRPGAPQYGRVDRRRAGLHGRAGLVARRGPRPGAGGGLPGPAATAGAQLAGRLGRAGAAPGLPGRRRSPGCSVTSPVVGVLALQGDVREHSRALSACGAQVTLVRRPADLAGLDALVLPGGESTTMDKLLRAQVAGGRPVYGSCAGMILLADRLADGIEGQQTIGGLDVTVRRNAFGRQVDSFEERLDAPALGAGTQDPELRAVFIRAPCVSECGPGVEVLATVSTGPAAGRIVAVRQGALMATAFHPEISGDLRIHRVFLETISRR